jgi:hypothetical protein
MRRALFTGTSSRPNVAPCDAQPMGAKEGRPEGTLAGKFFAFPLAGAMRPRGAYRPGDMRGHRLPDPRYLAGESLPGLQFVERRDGGEAVPFGPGGMQATPP